jgi:hypothetical protein
VGDAGTGGLMTVAVDSDSGFRPGTPRRLIQGQYEAPNTARQVYDVSPDDQRFLMIKRAQGDAAETQPQIVVVLNWLEELERLVPVD